MEEGLEVYQRPYDPRRPPVCMDEIPQQLLAGKRYIRVSERRTKVDWAYAMRYLADELYPDAEVIVVVMDNLNTHGPASFYKAFEPAEARRLRERFEFHYTPKHGSWLNMAEMELNALVRTCLNCRILDQATLHQEAQA